MPSASLHTPASRRTEPDPRDRVRQLLDGTDTTFLGGAHDALSARLVEEAGFDGVWASSFGIALASQCLPDVDLVTMSETLAVARQMRLATTAPLVVDCNAGWGDPVNVMRMIREFEAAGVDGVSIEDNAYPKRCSLYEGIERTLVSAEEMAAKIASAKAAQRDERFVVIARCESLIAGEGVEAARERVEAYAAAGADALLVHSRAFEPLREVIGEMALDRPLVVVPTLFGHISADELRRLGVRIVIYPNQAVRAAVAAMRETLAAMLSTGRPSALDAQIASLEEIEAIVRLDEIRAVDDARSVPSLAAAE